MSGGRSREQCPHRPPISTSTSRARESANPPRLERGGTRGSTGARDQFPRTILRSSIAEHPFDKWKTVAQYRAEGPSPVMSKQHARLLTGSSWCKSTLGSHFPHVDHVVTVSIPPCEGGSAGAIPVGQPKFQKRARGEESSHRPAKPKHPVQVRGARPHFQQPCSSISQSIRL